MKKRYKIILGAVLFAGAATAANYAIFKNVSERANSTSGDSVYSWRHGKINYIVRGYGKPLLLIHDLSAGSSLKEWKNVIEDLSQHYKVYALDLLGYGDSSKPDTSYSAYMFVTLINDFIRDVIGESVGIVTSSQSGAIGIMAYYFEPKLYNDLILVSPNGLSENSENVDSASLFTKWLLRTPVIGTSICNILMSKIFLKKNLSDNYFFNKNLVDEDLLDEYYYNAHRGGINAKVPFGEWLSGFLDVNVEHVLPKIDVPVAMIWGVENNINSVEVSDSFKKFKDDIEIYLIENARVLPQIEKSKEFSKLCLEFLEKNNG